MYRESKKMRVGECIIIEIYMYNICKKKFWWKK